MLNGLYVMDAPNFDVVYGPAERAAIERHLRIPPDSYAADQLTPEILADVDVLLTSWGAPTLTAELLAAAPKLALVLHGAGSVKTIATDESWDRGVRIGSAGSVIADSVAEFVFAQVVYALKHGWRYVLRSRESNAPAPRTMAELGANGAVIGLASLGAAGRATARLLSNIEVTLQAYDPFADPAVAAELGVRLVSLAELFATSDVVSLHLPLLPETVNLITPDLVRSMKPDTTLINTARGGVLDEPGLIDVLRERPDLFAVLDVTEPEPPVPGSPLFSLPNVVVTPHLAGSLGQERRRLGRVVAEELDRYVRGLPLAFEVSRAAFARAA
jgi:phosphoglycerate dehydrogenase-like enzyme